MKNQIYFLFIALLFCSCKAYKQVAYFQDLKGQGIEEENIKNYTTLRIQKDDLLSINISSLEPKASEIYNLGNASSSKGEGTSNAASGYLVDQNGDIQIPSFGSIHVAGLTTSEAKILIADKLSPFLGKPIVSLKLINFKISVLGDVSSPGVYPVDGERISLIEAISKAGDLNITGLRKNVLLVREIEGKRKFVRLDLNDKGIFNSPYYYLHPNDVLYVQPSNAKYGSVDGTSRNLGLVLSGISILLLVFTQFK